MPGLVKRIERELEERKRPGVGHRRLLQHVIQTALIRVFLELLASGARRLADDLGNLGPRRGQQFVAAEAIFQRRKSVHLTAPVKEIASDRADDPNKAATRQDR